MAVTIILLPNSGKRDRSIDEIHWLSHYKGNQPVYELYFERFFGGVGGFHARSDRLISV